ncbi:MAG: hypothetical protein JWO22_351 [Frankiales bacterium]|nr:hypothetical protein [Frankiales bacterium]
MHRLAVLVLLFAAACTGTSAKGQAEPTPTDSLPRQSVHLGGQPCGVAQADRAAWVTDASTAALYRIDPISMKATKRATLDPTPCELTYAFGALWVATQSGYLDRVDVKTGAVTHARVGEKSYEVEPALGALWVSDRDSAQLTRVDPTTLATSTLPLPGVKPGGLVFAFGYLWVGDDTSGSTSFLRVDPVHRTVKRVPAGQRPAYVTATSSDVWVSDVESGDVSRVDPKTLKGTTTHVGISPVNLDQQGGYVWVPDDQADAVYWLRLDGSIRQTFSTRSGSGPAVVAPVGNQMWVTLFGSGDVVAFGEISGCGGPSQLPGEEPRICDPAKAPIP